MADFDKSKSLNKREFKGLRAYLYPIYKSEIAKFLPIMLIFFFISINYHFLRIAKDSLIITAPKSGAEVLPFLKVWVMLPSAFIEAYIYTRLLKFFSKETTFYIIIGFILTFLLCFVLFIYPHKEQLYLDSFADYLQTILPAGFKGLIAILRYWMFTLFYVIAESWSFMVLTVLLWGFANDTITVNEAKRFYPLFGIGINFAGVLVGKFASVIASSTSSKLSSLTVFLGGKTAWDETFNVFVVIILGCGVLSLILYRWVVAYILPKDSVFMKRSDLKEKKPKLSIFENIRYVAKSKYLICITIIVLAYNILINFTEVLWKGQLKALYPDPQHYVAYFSQVIFFIGIVATLGSIFISGNLIRKFGWRLTALATPIVFVVTGLFFFYFVFAQNWSTGTALFLGMTPLALAVFFGSIQDVLSRSAKYTVYDSTKEMAFIPLDAESRLKGKASIDGIGTRLGKSGASFVLQILLIFFNTVLACTPVIFLFVVLIVPVWVAAIFSLDKKFQRVTKKQPQEAIPSI
jgi:ATP:ADP antiporter, AAA family